MNTSALFLILALLAEVVGTVGGFGSSVFFVPIGNFFFDFHSVLGLTALFHLSSNLSKIYLFKKGLNKFLLTYVGIPSVIFVIAGGILSNYIDSAYLEISLGIFLIGFSLLFLIKKNWSLKANKSNSIWGGILSGFSAGLLGTGGAVRGLTMASFNLEKSTFIATSAAIDLIIDFSRTIVYYQNGYIHQHDLIYVPFLLIIGMLGTYLGKRLLQYIPQASFIRTSLLLILSIGIITSLKFFYNYL